MDVPVIGLVENMSYVECGDCGKQIKLFGESKIDEIAASLGTKVLGKMPIDPKIAALCDAGEIEKFNFDGLNDAADYIEKEYKL